MSADQQPRCAKCGEWVGEEPVLGEYEGKGQTFCSEAHKLVYELKLWADERGIPDEPQEESPGVDV